MHLEMATFPVRDVKSGNRTSYNKGVLEINHHTPQLQGNPGNAETH